MLNFDNIDMAIVEVTNLSQQLVRWYFTDGSGKKLFEIWLV